MCDRTSAPAVDQRTRDRRRTPDRALCSSSLSSSSSSPSFSSSSSSSSLSSSQKPVCCLTCLTKSSTIGGLALPFCLLLLVGRSRQVREGRAAVRTQLRRLLGPLGHLSLLHPRPLSCGICERESGLLKRFYFSFFRFFFVMTSMSCGISYAGHLSFNRDARQCRANDPKGPVT